MFLTIKKLVGGSAAVVLIAAWFYSGSLDDSYVYYSRTPISADGQIVPYRVKGVVVYITEDQRMLLSWLTWIEICAGAIVGLVILVHGGDPFKRRDGIRQIDITRSVMARLVRAIHNPVTV
jgi:hypothetical protein